MLAASSCLRLAGFLPRYVDPLPLPALFAACAWQTSRWATMLTTSAAATMVTGSVWVYMARWVHVDGACSFTNRRCRVACGRRAERTTVRTRPAVERIQRSRGRALGSQHAHAEYFEKARHNAARKRRAP
jgi:hypothetical protein